ncbi:MAG TPA: asparagine synthase C-terminal domain-containing protein [Nitrosopumilaceae archaeon]|nr:asparagine synthase C-terminal domain-containing protein [Nitrosopumilaceae archaeon]
MQPKINYNSISKILTLRYDPEKVSIMKPLSYKDFIPTQINDIESKINDIVKKDLLIMKKKSGTRRISLSLSGGVDSGLTLAIIRSVLPDIKIECFSMGFRDTDDEIQRAKEISRIYDCNFHNIIKDDVLNELPQLIYIAKEPRWNLYQYYPMANARKQSSIFYSGDGGDELFGGYTFRYKKFLAHLPKKADWKNKTKLYLSCHERDWVPDQHKMFGSKIKFSWEKIYKTLKPYFNNDLEPIDQVFLADFNGKLLYDWIPTNNAFGKYLDLDIKSIFLTDKMIKFATHIPWNVKYDPKKIKGKIPLHSILRRQKGFEKIQPIKKGFSIDLCSLWRKNAKEIINTYVNSESEIVKNKIINEEWLNTVHKKLRQDNSELNVRYISKMLGILSLEIWYRLFISKTMKKTQKL